MNGAQVMDKLSWPALAAKVRSYVVKEVGDDARMSSSDCIDRICGDAMAKLRKTMGASIETDGRAAGYQSFCHALGRPVDAARLALMSELDDIDGYEKAGDKDGSLDEDTRAEAEKGADHWRKVLGKTKQ